MLLDHMKIYKFIKITSLLIILVFSASCASKDKENDETVIKKKRINPNVTEKVRDSKTDGLFSKAIGKGSGNFEFATSNVLWRASLKTLNFMPLSTVSYSGGVIVTDWYGKNEDEMIKLTIRFLSNDLALSSVEISGFKKVCNLEKCTITKTNSALNNEIKSKIIEEAKILKLKEEQKK